MVLPRRWRTRQRCDLPSARSPGRISLCASCCWSRSTAPPRSWWGTRIIETDESGIADDNLSEIAAGLVVTKSRDDFAKRKDPIDDGSQSMHGDGAVHAVELCASANGDAVHLDDSRRNGTDVDSRCLFGKRSDHADLPLCGGCLERLFERAGATDLDDNVGAATAGQSAHGDVPIGRGSVI